MCSIVTEIRTNNTVRVRWTSIRSMFGISAFKTVPCPIIGGTTIIANVAKVPTPVALDGSRLHQFDPRDRPPDIDFTSS